MLEQFAKLNAKTLNITAGSGIKPLLEITDLCGVLASLEDHHSWYVYAMIEQRRAYNMDLLHRYCQQIILQEMLKRKFKSKIITASEFAHGVTKAALYAHFHPKGKCKACNGLGFKAATRCEMCGGKGSREYNWSERVEYGFPMRKDLTRKWYLKSCSHYDRLVTSIMYEIQGDLIEKLTQIKRQAKAYRREENGDLLDGL